MADNRLPTSTPILIIGAGPVGLSLAIELRLHNIPVTILDRTPTIEDSHPKGRANDMRTVEHYRRWGVSDEIRELAWKTENPRQELVITQTLLEEPIGRFPLRLGRDAVESRDFVAEPSLSVPQPVLMRVLERKARELGAIVFRGWEATDVIQDGEQVITTVRAPDGSSHTITSSYVIGADGPNSLVRRKAGIDQDGTGPLGRTWTYVVRSQGYPISNLIAGEKYAALGMLMVVNANASSILSIPGSDEWGFGILRTGAQSGKEPSDDEVKSSAQNLLGTPTNIEIISRSSYASMTRLSKQYRRGRFFIAGDACHICPPTGGHNMNTGIEDAVNLAWKLAAVLQGWGGEDLLDSYEAERRPVGERVSGVAMANSLAMQKADGFLNEDRAVGLSGTEKAQAIYENTYTQWNSYGVVLDQRYDSSPVIIRDGWDDAPAWNPTEYWSHARPGHRAPHLWLEDGRALHDCFGRWFTLLTIGARREIVEEFVAAANRVGVPVEVLEVTLEIAREKYPATLTLIRPDGYVAWQGERDECDPVDVIRRVSGNGPRLRDLKL
ncbi:FAD binding domain-containing protein [Aspergillus pseudodeflectus]|uniref:FAD binding domain-containing protein n=1 Tax=Aspergillus pseudodeflectus TaxID=176178 RepID=A0ABR4JRG7_9EURO